MLMKHSKLDLLLLPGKVIPTPSDAGKRQTSASWKENRENKLLAKERKQLERDLEQERVAKLVAIKELTTCKSRLDSVEQELCVLRKEAAKWKKEYTSLVVKYEGKEEFKFAVPKSTQRKKTGSIASQQHPPLLY